ncbi:MAG: hypothetical protein WA633_24800 [Stellaceae bacterium]
MLFTGKNLGAAKLRSLRRMSLQGFTIGGGDRPLSGQKACRGASRNAFGADEIGNRRLVIVLRRSLPRAFIDHGRYSVAVIPRR